MQIENIETSLKGVNVQVRKEVQQFARDRAVCHASL